MFLSPENEEAQLIDRTIVNRFFSSHHNLKLIGILITKSEVGGGGSISKYREKYGGMRGGNFVGPTASFIFSMKNEK